jgi:hypothetical protein
MFEERHLGQYQHNARRCSLYVFLVDFLSCHAPSLDKTAERLPENLNRDELWLPARRKPLHS